MREARNATLFHVTSAGGPRPRSNDLGPEGESVYYQGVKEYRPSVRFPGRNLPDSTLSSHRNQQL